MTLRESKLILFFHTIKTANLQPRGCKLADES